MTFYIERHDPDKTVALYYQISIQPNLFGEWSLQRDEGRIRQDGRVRLDLFGCEDNATRALLVLEQAKQKHSYEHAKCVIDAYTNDTYIE